MAVPSTPGEVSYNGFVFPGNAVTTFTETPVLSEDGRMVKFSEIDITVRGYIAQDTTTTTGITATGIAVAMTSQVTSIVITNGGSGYTSAPTVTIGPPLQGGIQATATATITGGAVTGVTITNQGNGYDTPPAVTFSAPPPQLNSTDVYVETMRRLLSKPGRRLVYNQRGAGTSSLIVDPGGPIRDVRFGPVPGPLKLKPLGGAPLGVVAAFFEWSVKTYLPDCTSAVNTPAPGVFTQFSYTVDVSINEAGYSVVTYSGNYEIPLALLADGRSILATTDQYWPRVLGDPIEGWQRTTQRKISPDRRRLEYTTVDTQQPGQPLPRDIVRANIRQRIHNPTAMNVLNWHCTISGDVTCSAVATKSAAWLQIYDILAKRILVAQTLPINLFVVGPGGRQVTVQGTGAVIILSFDVTDSWFSDEFSFSMTYRIAGVSLADILQASGMWLTIGTNWAAWQASMSRQQSAGGLATWRYDQSKDTLIDLCDPTAAGATTSADEEDTPDDADDEDLDDEISVEAAASEPGPLMLGEVPPAPPGGDSGSGAGPAPVVLGAPPDAGSQMTPGGLFQFLDPEMSWLHWDCSVEYSEDGNLVRHVPLAGSVQYDSPAVDALGPAGLVAADVTPPTVGVTTDTADIIQQVSHPTATIVLTGAAMRMGYPINPPRLTQYGGVALGPPESQRIVPGNLMNAAGIPVYSLVWRITYLLPQPPAKLPYVSNPWLGTDNQTLAS